MGSIRKKLERLAETKQKLREVLIIMGAEVSDEDTFNSYAEKFLTAPSDTSYIADIYGGKNFVFKDLIGEYKPSGEDMICPHIVYTADKNWGRAYTIPYVSNGYRTSWYDYSPSKNVRLNYQKIQVVDKGNQIVRLRLSIIGTSVIRLVLPTNIYLDSYMYHNEVAIRYDSNSFKEGLAFGSLIIGGTSNWMKWDLHPDVLKIVKFPPNFKMLASANLYLTKIAISKESLQEMIQNMYDYIGTGEETTIKRTIHIGTANLGRLTSKEIATANAKGWKIT